MSAQAAPPTAPPPQPSAPSPHQIGAANESDASKREISALAAQGPTTVGVLHETPGLWVNADLDLTNQWNVELWDSSGVHYFEEPLRQRENHEIHLSEGGYYFIALWNWQTQEQIDIGWYDVQAPIERLYGTSRFETSGAIAFESFGASTPVVFVANAFNFPDALSGAAAAGALGGPVLLTAAGSLSDAIKTQLDRLDPGKIVVLGGASVVNDAVMTELAGYTAGTVERYAGASRFETSAAISEKTFATGVPVAYLANGFNFPDALSGAAAAGTLGGPVLLTSADALPEAVKAELTRLSPSKIIVLGGTSVVSEAVEDSLNPFSGTVERLAGTSRFETSAAISAATFPGDSPNVPIAYVANAFNFPDALSGAAAAGSLGGPVLLSAPGALSPAVKAELERLNPARIVVLGGPDVVNNSVKNELGVLAETVVERAAGDYVTADPVAGPAISNVVITSNSISVTVSFDYTHPDDWYTPAYVGIYPGSPTDYPYGDKATLGDWGLRDGFRPWLLMPDDVRTGHASQSFPIYGDGPLTVMIFGTQICECAGGTEFMAGRDFAAVP
ncbi:cell wall-binding repeat-containing protein [Microbacterium sp. cf046]|uniref:cell wall-binding repeat-containing protein n=1 Tax=Microbacterium sp. cf046 TaxID=1761803 RepID=UPI0015878AFF|nr:cell wall-binding repeat-containing protein [Microbacterium sp. cf046]